MARETLTVEKVLSSGLVNPTYTTMTTDGVEFKNTGNELIIFKAGAAETVITIITTEMINGDLNIDDRVITLQPEEELLVAGLDKKYFNTDEGFVHIDSDQTDTEVLVVNT